MSFVRKISERIAYGALAQLVARYIRIVEVTGSNPVCSTQGLAEVQVLFLCFGVKMQDLGVKGFTFVNDVNVLTPILTPT